MKAFLIVVAAVLLHTCEATFGGQGSGNLALSGNFHGLLNHQKKENPPPAEIIPEAPVETVGPANNGGSGFSLTGSIHGLLKNHRFLGAFNKKGQAATTEAPFDLGFDGDNTGYSVSTGNEEEPVVNFIAPEPIVTEQVENSGYQYPEPSTSSGSSPEINQASEIPQPINDAPIVSGHASFSKSGGHNIHKILG